MRRWTWLAGLGCVCAISGASRVGAQGALWQPIEYKVVATTKTGTLQKELNAAADLGFRFAAVMGGETAFGGKEVVVVMSRSGSAPRHFEYQILATNKTGTMQKEMSKAAEGGFEYRGQTISDTTFGGKEVLCVMERDKDAPAQQRYDFQMSATSKTSTFEKELNELGKKGYEVQGMTVADTAFGGSELVAITRRPTR